MRGIGNHTALVTKVTVGKVDHVIALCITLGFNMNGSSCFLIFNMDEVEKMMSDSGCYDNVNELVGKPCQIRIDEKNICHFDGMWKDET